MISTSIKSNIVVKFIGKGKLTEGIPIINTYKHENWLENILEKMINRTELYI